MNFPRCSALSPLAGVALVWLMPTAMFAVTVTSGYSVWSKGVDVIAEAGCTGCSVELQRATPPAQKSPKPLLADVYDLAASSSNPSNGGTAEAQTEMFFTVLYGRIQAAAFSHTEDSDPPLSVDMVSQSNVSAELGWDDTLEFHGPESLPLKYQFHFDVHGDLSATGDDDGYAAASYNAIFGATELGFFATGGIGTCEGKLRDSSGIGADTCGGGPLVQSITVKNGDRWGISSEFQMSTLAISQGSSDHHNATVGFQQTVQLFIVPLTEGATFTSASGATYSFGAEPTPVPEPSTLLMLGIGSLALLRKLPKFPHGSPRRVLAEGRVAGVVG